MRIDHLEANLSVDEEVYGIEENTNDDYMEDEEGDNEMASESQELEAKTIIEEDKGIVWTSKVIELLKQIYGDVCPSSTCNRHLCYKTTFIGCAFKISWSCCLGHNPGSWFSQPRFENMFAGNLMMAAAILMSGNSFMKTTHFCRSMGLKHIGKDTFYRVQRLFVAPVVKEFWSRMQREIMDSFGENGVTLAGDGRCDSPGHSAQYCSYVFTDNNSRRVLHVEVVDVREAGGKSPNMEKLAFEKGMEFLMKQINVEEIVTDGHMQIAALMKNSVKFKDVTHQQDIWHGAKNIAKRVSKVSKKGENRVLQSWIPSIRNHFWYSSQICNGDTTALKACFLGILHHVSDEHEWVNATDVRHKRCQNESLSDEEREKSALKVFSAT